MKKQVISLFLAFGISLVAGAQPQEKRRAITLEEAITIARVQSVDAAVLGISYFPCGFASGNEF